jgi:hypothetical protein
VNILEGEKQEFAAICEHGHIISSALAYDASTGSDKFCEKCGARVYQKCPHCHTPVRGLLLRLDISSLDSEPEFFGKYGPYYAVNDPYVPPSYCYNCGKEFPWTAEIRKQVDAIVRRSSKDITPEEQALISQAWPSILGDHVDLESASKVGKILKKLGPAVRDIIVNVSADLLSAMARKATGL